MPEPSPAPLAGHVKAQHTPGASGLLPAGAPMALAEVTAASRSPAAHSADALREPRSLPGIPKSATTAPRRSRTGAALLPGTGAPCPRLPAEPEQARVRDHPSRERNSHGR